MTPTRRDPTCRELEQRFEALLEGRLAATERARLEGHLDACPSCRDLAEVARALGATPPPQHAPDLVGTVLARTVGDACGRARDLLCDLVDGSLDATDERLVQAHARRCADCGGTAAVLERLSAEMRRMAVVEPDPRFVRDVMRATLGPDARWRLLVARLSDGWSRLVTRPRFGLEAAYVGAMLLAAVFGLPFSPLRDVPERALEFARRGSTAAVDYSNAVGQVPERVAVLGGKAWSATGAQGIASLRGASDALSERYERTAPVREALRENGGRLRQATREGDLPGSRDSLKNIGKDLGDFVRLITVTDTPQDDRDNEDRDTPPPAAGRG